MSSLLEAVESERFADRIRAAKWDVIGIVLSVVLGARVA